MFHSSNTRYMVGVLCIFVVFTSLLPAQATSDYTYSSMIATGEIFSWEVEEFHESLDGYPDGFYITDGYYISEGSIISVEVVTNPTEIFYNSPPLLWNTTTSWYNLYINNTLVNLSISMTSMMTLGFLQLPYISPTFYQTNNAFREIYDQESEFNHTSTGTLDETSDHPIDYIRSELYSSEINGTAFTAESTLIYTRTQVISENLTYRWIWEDNCEVTFDLDSGILLEQDQVIMNASKIIETDEIGVSEITSYCWLVSSLVSNYTGSTLPSTNETSFILLNIGVSLIFLGVYFLNQIKRKKGNKGELC